MPLLYRDVMSPERIAERARAGQPPRRAFSLSQFLASPGMVVNGEIIKRREVITYVANKLGGTHFDPTRRADERAYFLLDDVLGDIRIADRRAPYLELLSIGQAVAASSDARELRSLIESTLTSG